MDRGVEVVHELRADGGLGQHEIHRRLGGPSVRGEDGHKATVPIDRLPALRLDQLRHQVRQARERLAAPPEKLPDLAARGAADVAR